MLVDYYEFALTITVISELVFCNFLYTLLKASLKLFAKLFILIIQVFIYRTIQKFVYSYRSIITLLQMSKVQNIMYARGTAPSREIKKLNQQAVMYEHSSRMSPAPPSHSPGNWKKYLTNDSRLKGGMSRNNSEGNFNNYQSFQGAFQLQKKQLGGPTNIDKYETQKKRKQQMKKRVQQIQRKVLPILKAQKNNQEQQQDFGWYNRMEQRIMKLETNIDSIQKQLQIKIQKRLLEVQREWEHRIQVLVSSSHNKRNKIQKSKMGNIQFKNQQNLQQEIEQHEQGQNYQLQNGKGRNYFRGQTVDEGYYTKRQNQNSRNGSDQQKYMRREALN